KKFKEVVAYKGVTQPETHNELLLATQ
ncbi:MAG: hypothetical protein JWQ40_4311, partial [Segetibacter sp.]|nr:hypothetical protein [Segetibacter sp.]